MNANSDGRPYRAPFTSDFDSQASTAIASPASQSQSTALITTPRRNWNFSSQRSSPLDGEANRPSTAHAFRNDSFTELQVVRFRDVENDRPGNRSRYAELHRPGRAPLHPTPNPRAPVVTSEPFYQQLPLSLIQSANRPRPLPRQLADANSALRRPARSREDDIRRLQGAVDSVDQRIDYERSKVYESVISWCLCNGDDMLSINFSAPLSGPQRSGRALQMSNQHPAWTVIREIMNGLNHIQMMVRNTPGIPANVAEELRAAAVSLGQSIVTDFRPVIEQSIQSQIATEEARREMQRWSDRVDVKSNEIDRLSADLKHIQGALKTTGKQVHGFLDTSVETYEEVKNALAILDAAKEGDEKLAAQTAVVVIARKMVDRDIASSVKDIKNGIEKVTRFADNIVGGHTKLTPVHEDDKSQGQAQDRGGEPSTPATSRTGFAPIDRDVALYDQHFGNGSPSTALTAPRMPPPRTPQPQSQVQAQQPRLHSQSLSQPQIQTQTQTQPQSQFGTPHRPASVHPEHMTRSESRLSNYPAQRGGLRPDAPQFQPRGSAMIGGRGGGHTRNNMSVGPMGMNTWNPPSNGVFSPAGPQMGRRNTVGRNGFGGGGGYGHASGSTRTNAPDHPFAQGPPLASSSNALVLASNNNNNNNNNTGRSTGNPNVISMRAAFDDLFALIRGWIARHYSQPYEHRSMNVQVLRANGSLWRLLVAAYSPLNPDQAAAYLDVHLKDVTARGCLISRIIIDYFVYRIWNGTAWVGFNESTTRQLTELVASLGRHENLVGHNRQPLLDRQAKVINSIVDGPHYVDFQLSKIRAMCEELRSTTQSLLNPNSELAVVDRELHAIATRAWEISSRLLSSRLSFDFRFPATGARFATSSMMAITPDMDPADLQMGHWRVALVVTPVITARNDTANEVEVHTISLADVVCMH